MAIEITQGGGVIVKGTHVRCSYYLFDGVNQLGINNFDFFITNTTDIFAVTYGDFASAFYNAIVGTYQVQTCALTRHLGMKCSALTIHPLPLPGIVSDDASVGAAAGKSMPGQVTGITTFVGLLAGKGMRGRKYWAFPPEAHQDTNLTPDSTLVGDFDSLASGYVGFSSFDVGFESITVSPVIFHRKDGTGSNIVSHTTRKRWATQMRRGNYGKTNLPIIA